MSELFTTVDPFRVTASELSTPSDVSGRDVGLLIFQAHGSETAKPIVTIVCYQTTSAPFITLTPRLTPKIILFVS